MYERNVSSASFRLMYIVNGQENVSLDMFCCFWVSLRQKNGFCVLVNVHEMANIRKFPCKQYVSTEKNIEVFKHFMAFLRTLVTALTIPVRIMCLCFCPEQVFASNLRGCLGKIRPLILLQKFDFLHKLGFRSPYLVNHENEFHLMKKSNWNFLDSIEVRFARHKSRACRNWKIAHIAGALKKITLSQKSQFFLSTIDIS